MCQVPMTCSTQDASRGGKRIRVETPVRCLPSPRKGRMLVRIAWVLSIAACAAACSDQNRAGEASGEEAGGNEVGGNEVGGNAAGGNEAGGEGGDYVGLREIGTGIDEDWTEGPLKINEAYAADTGDWIELYNNSSEAVDIGGWSVEDHYSLGVEKDPPGTYTLPVNTSIAAQGYFTVSRQVGCDTTVDAFVFGIGPRDELRLYDDAGRVVDTLGWGWLPEGASFGRYPNGTRHVGLMGLPTKGTANQEHCTCCVACSGLGLCDTSGDSCVTTDDRDCQQSMGCTNKGWCAARDGVCRAGSDLDCANSSVCLLDGRCTLGDGGRCIATTDVDCRGASICSERGRCEAEEAECVASTDADCQQSKDCVKKARCYALDKRCVATADDDCARSEICASKGCCRLVDGKCVL